MNTRDTPHAKPASRWRLAALLATTLALGACGGGGGDGGSAGDGGGGAGPSATVPDSAMESMSNFMRFMANWAADDTVEPLLLNDEPPPRDDGQAWPIG